MAERLNKELQNRINNGITKGQAPDHPAQILKTRAEEAQLDVWSEAFARFMDKQDQLQGFRDKFHYPKMKELPNSK